MSLTTDNPTFLQRILRAAGFYTGEIDGKISPGTQDAFKKFKQAGNQLGTEIGSFDSRTEGNIRTLLPKAQAAARNFMKTIGKAGLPAGTVVRIISGTRTYAEQEVLYKKYKAGTGGQAAAPGYSNHNFGIAWDVGIFQNNGAVYIDDLVKPKKMTQKAVDAEYRLVGEYGKSLGLYWGGDWKKKPDYPHHQMLDNDQLAAIRQKFVNGGAIL